MVQVTKGKSTPLAATSVLNRMSESFGSFPDFPSLENVLNTAKSLPSPSFHAIYALEHSSYHPQVSFSPVNCSMKRVHGNSPLHHNKKKDNHFTTIDTLPPQQIDECIKSLSCWNAHKVVLDSVVNGGCQCVVGV